MTQSPPLELPSLRPVVANDEAFLRELYRSTRVDELAPLAWSDAQVDAFCNSQFHAQTQGYRAAYPNAEHLLIYTPAAPVGRLIKAWIDEGLLLIDIALLPEFRNKGWGSALIRDLQDEARRAARPILAQVEVNTAAPRFYRRLGFVTTGNDGVRFFMNWTPTRNDS